MGKPVPVALLCDTIEEIIIPESNTDYVLIDGVVYSSDMSKICSILHPTETFNIRSEVQTIQGYCFYRGFNTIHLGNVETINGTNINATKIYAPNIVEIRAYAITNVTTLIVGNKFSRCIYNIGGDNLKTFICENTVPPGINNNTFGTNCPIKTGTGYIYVPSDYVSVYQEDTNWSSVASQIKPINVADTLPAIGSVAENDLYKIGEVYWKAELVDNVLTWVEI